MMLLRIRSYETGLDTETQHEAVSCYCRARLRRNSGRYHEPEDIMDPARENWHPRITTPGRRILSCTGCCL